jgi:hypothetical protein
MAYKQVQHLKPEVFRRLCGARPETFAEMVAVLEEKARRKRKPGRPSKLSLPGQLLMTLQYWREYRTYFHIAQSWGVDESTAHRLIRSVEDTLIHSGRFALPGKKKLYAAEHEIEVLGVDVTETPVERPKKQRQFYAGKKKQHTLKSQVVVDPSSDAIVCTTYAKGRVHDFRVFKAECRLMPRFKS